MGCSDLSLCVVPRHVRVLVDTTQCCTAGHGIESCFALRCRKFGSWQPGIPKRRVPASQAVTYTVRMRPICFISDYGLTDVLEGTCHGVMKGIAPGATIIDVTHNIPGFDVIRGAEALRHATRYMPEDSVYLAVVDPGDKTKRRALAAEVRSGAYLVGPDNGTHLAAGANLDDLGEGVTPASMVSLDFPGFRREPGGGVAAEIINIDRFGNARLSVMQEDLDLPYDTPLEIGIRNEVIEARYVETFGTAEDGDLVAVPDSHWRLSLAVNRGNAARALLLSVGDEVRLTPSEGTA